jgi:hypothetical protein
MVGFIIRTNTKFRDLKAIIRPVLDRHSAWIYQHTLAFTQLDIVPLGYLTHTNPRFHSTACVSDEIRSLLIGQYTQLSGAVRHKFEDDHGDYFDDETMIDPPQLLIAPANINSGDEKSRAFEIQVERQHLPALKFLLEEIYAIIPPLMTDSKFVPYSLKHDSPDIYRSILRTQNIYLETHRNIPLAGITIVQMHEEIDWDGGSQTPFQILRGLPGVSRVDSTARTHDLGKFNMSTTADTYVSNTAWIDDKLASLFDRTTPNDCLKDGDFSTPVRMGRRLGGNRRSTASKKPSAYTQHLRSQYATTVGIPPPPPTNAWQNRSRPAPTFNYTVENFPSLHPPPAPVTPGNQPVTPAYHQAPSLSSQSTMTDAQTRSYIADCVQHEQDKLSASQARLSADITLLCTDVKTMIDDSLKSQNERIQGFIRDAIAANTQSVNDSLCDRAVCYKEGNVDTLCRFQTRIAFYAPCRSDDDATSTQASSTPRLSLPSLLAELSPSTPTSCVTP